MARRTTRSWMTWISEVIGYLLTAILILGYILMMGCSGLTIGPVVEKKAIIVRAGTAIEIVEQVEVDARLLKKDGATDIFQQDVGGWVTMHPDHWDALKREVERLRKKAGEE